MIGVVVRPAQRGVAQEFFELFKTPWEFYRPEEPYDVILSDGSCEIGEEAPKLLLMFCAHDLSVPCTAGIEAVRHADGSRYLSYKTWRIPVYQEIAVFPSRNDAILLDEESRQPVAYREQFGERVVLRIGYDLFTEVRRLLTRGQPEPNASFPTMEMHISLVRDLIVVNGIPLVEIPPVPNGYRFTVCLTHDVDHPLLRNHKFDHTMFGFLYRATIGCLIMLCRRRLHLKKLLRNWVAAIKLPLVHLGIVRDFWLQFDRYHELEAGLPSSFFFVPFKGYPGRTDHGWAPERRAAAYEVGDLTKQIHSLMCAGCEIGLHGIDAWRDPKRGRDELEQIRQITGFQDVGVRMHWLYNDDRSPTALEEAGAAYDSTIGYNATVGFRAGTTQVYKPLTTVKLLELPLHIMDTALFFPGYLDLSPAEASCVVDSIIDSAVHFGGVVTLNWHDRSIAPERLWGDFYLRLIEKLKERGAWFATANDAVSWFRWRRSAVFEHVNGESTKMLIRTTTYPQTKSPGLSIRIYDSNAASDITSITAPSSDHLSEGFVLPSYDASRPEVANVTV